MAKKKGNKPAGSYLTRRSYRKSALDEAGDIGTKKKEEEKKKKKKAVALKRKRLKKKYKIGPITTYEME